MLEGDQLASPIVIETTSSTVVKPAVALRNPSSRMVRIPNDRARSLSCEARVFS